MDAQKPVGILRAPLTADNFFERMDSYYKIKKSFEILLDPSLALDDTLADFRPFQPSAFKVLAEAWEASFGPSSATGALSALDKLAEIREQWRVDLLAGAWKATSKFFDSNAVRYLREHPPTKQEWIQAANDLNWFLASLASLPLAASPGGGRTSKKERQQAKSSDSPDIHRATLLKHILSTLWLLAHTFSLTTLWLALFTCTFSPPVESDDKNRPLVESARMVLATIFALTLQNAWPAVLDSWKNRRKPAPVAKVVSPTGKVVAVHENANPASPVIRHLLPGEYVLLHSKETRRKKVTTVSSATRRLLFAGSHSDLMLMLPQETICRKAVAVSPIVSRVFPGEYGRLDLKGTRRAKAIVVEFDGDNRPIVIGWVKRRNLKRLSLRESYALSAKIKAEKKA